MKNREAVTNWVLDQVKNEYRDDIALVVSHTTLRIDENEKAMSYFVPITKRGREFARTFILDGEGFDIWGIEWERLEQFARLEEYNITCLADGEILYARTEADRDRFEELQSLQAKYLKDDVMMRKCALEAYEQAKNIFLETTLGKGSDVKLGAGYVLDYLARAIAFTNHSYFKKSQTDQMNELREMANVPDGFSELYRKVIVERSDEEQKKLCYEMMMLVQDFLKQNAIGQNCVADTTSAEHNFQDLADWYAELSYTWLRIRVYSDRKDILKTYMWGIVLQEELNHVCADFDLEKIDLMSAFDAQDLTGFADHANELEVQIRDVIQEHGGIIREYHSAEELLNEV